MVITSNLATEVKQCLTENILPFWLNRMQDRERGGWYGQMLSDGTLVPDAERGAILNARILWAFSAAYRVLEHQEYLDAATRTYRYILDHFVDKDFGGTYWSVNADGKPADMHKQFYAQGFMIYGLSEYHRATGNQQALLLAIDIFNLIEQHSRDNEHGGYIEACTRQWQPMQDMRLSEKDANYPKSQNTHLHIIEPYTNLYRVWPDPRLREAIISLLQIFNRRIFNPATGHLSMFFANDWTPIAQHWVSYGHDIECSWLMHEAAMVLGDDAILHEIEPTVKALAKASDEGLQPDGSMIHESKGSLADAVEATDASRHWWVQAEAVVGYYNIYQHFGDTAALDKALRLWQYIKSNLINHTLGEWYWSIDATGKPSTDEDQAGFWKCPYHNTRMCLELFVRS